MSKLFIKENKDFFANDLDSAGIIKVIKIITNSKRAIDFEKVILISQFLNNWITVGTLSSMI